MFIEDTKPDTDLLYRTAVAFMALIAVGTAGRIMHQLFGGHAIEQIGLGIAAISMIVLCFTVVSAAPYRRELSPNFMRVVVTCIVCNAGSHLVWLATLAIGGYI